MEDLSITDGCNPRQHIWTYVVGINKIDSDLDNCPCTQHPGRVPHAFFCKLRITIIVSQLSQRVLLMVIIILMTYYEMVQDVPRETIVVMTLHNLDSIIN